jgi:hypothetical protein
MRKLAAVAVLLVLGACRDRGSAVDAELARLESKNARVAKLIASARETTSPDVRLYRLRDAYVAIETQKFLAAHPVTDVAALEAVWKQFPAKRHEPAQGSLLEAALVEQSANYGEKFRAASLPYGKASGPQDGIYYLAEGEARLAFADFVASLPPGPREAPPDREQLRAALQQLEREAYELYEKEPATRRTASVSARLKETRELLEANMLAGATLTLLEARRELSNDAPAGNGANSLLRALEATPSVASLYDSMQSRKLAVAKTASAPVVVTLIRWPYT